MAQGGEVKELQIQDCSTVERIRRAVYEYKAVHIEPQAIALGPHEYLSFREVESRKHPLRESTGTVSAAEPPSNSYTTEMSFMGYPIFSTEVDGIHILGQRDAAMKSMYYRARNRLPFLAMGIKGEDQK